MLEAENMQVTVPISPLFLYYFICHSIRKDSYHSKDNNNNMNKRFLDGVCLDIEFKNVYKKNAFLHFSSSLIILTFVFPREMYVLKFTMILLQLNCKGVYEFI